MRTTNIFFDAIKDGPNEVEKTKQATKTAAGSVDRLPSTTVHEKRNSALWTYSGHYL